MKSIAVTTGVALLGFFSPALAQDMQRIGEFAIDRTEVTVGQFRRFVAATSLSTKAEQDGGGFVYEAGWVRKPGWTWKAPYGKSADDREPAVHITYDEAQAYCRWAGKRLPTDAQWRRAAYVETRSSPPVPFKRGVTYRYPTGNIPAGANCLGDCGPTNPVKHGALLARGAGHALAGTTKAGVNGLYDMGANVWEWVDDGDKEKRTRGGSWWYGAFRMAAGDASYKPRGFPAVYIGFRCVRAVKG
jgi:sulfatase modifying factor 1